jgi:hypothetical protein
VPGIIHTKDALVTAIRLMGAALDLGIERIGSLGRRRSDAHPSGSRGLVPDSVTAITPAWLTNVLQHRFPGVRVAAVRRAGGDAGTTERARLAVDYETPGTGSSPPATLFLKLPPRDAKTRLFVNLMALGDNEVSFYREIAPALAIDVPRVFHVACQGRARRFVLLLEDLAARGARFTDVSHHVTLEEARMVVRTLARLHERFWDSPLLSNELRWLRHHDRNRNYPVERFLCAAAVPAALRKYPDLVPHELHDSAPLVVAMRDRLEAAWAAGPLTVIHGDAHVGNMYFCETSGLLDWQVVQCGQGMRDVAYFLTNSLPTGLRRAHEHELIRTYLGALADLGLRPPDFDSAWLEYRLHALYAWIAAAVTAAAATLQTETIVRAGLARAGAAVVDLASLEALQRL